jgi:hypothetical protein
MISRINNFHFIIFLIFTCFLYGCASTGRLTGGPRDEEAPKLDTLLSAPMMATMVSQKQFEFLFDEFVEVRNAIQEVLISPPLTYIPKIIARGKKLVLQFNEKEKLKDSTTYVINFGNSIVDLNESNQLKNFTYVFSTGSIIDSLGVEGLVIDAITQKPLEDIAILLHDQLSDSVFMSRKPFYATRSIKDGIFKITNIKRDSFRLFAVKDENKSYTYNLGTEEMGFLPPLLLFDDTTKIYRCTIEVSNPLIDYKIFDNDNSNYGLLKQRWNTSIHQPPIIKTSSDSTSIFYDYVKDTVKIWYNTEVDTIDLDLGFTNQKYKVPTKSTKLKTFFIENLSYSGTLAFQDSIILKTSNPFKKIDKSLIQLIDTSGSNIQFDIKEVSFNRIYLTLGHNKSTLANLKLKRGAFVDIFDNLSDTANYNFTLIADDQTSEIDINLANLDSLINYKINFIDANDRVLSSYNSTGTSSFKIKKSRLRPEAYKIEVIEDQNTNGRWDPVNWWRKTQAERKKIINVDKLRENWTLETELQY